MKSPKPSSNIIHLPPDLPSFDQTTPEKTPGNVSYTSGNNRWTPIFDKYLMENYPTTDSDSLILGLSKLGKDFSKYSVSSRANLLGLKKERQDLWNEKYDDFLRKNYKSKTIEFILNGLKKLGKKNITWTAVEHRVHIIRLVGIRSKYGTFCKKDKKHVLNTIEKKIGPLGYGIYNRKLFKLVRIKPR